jgi:hypothetical protein
MQYVLVSEPTEEQLADEVNALLIAGWQLYGSPTISAYVNADGQTHTIYGQAMTREEE